MLTDIFLSVNMQKDIFLSVTVQDFMIYFAYGGFTMTVGENIKRIRKEKGYTQKELAEKCEMYESQIRKYELDKANPKIETIGKVADALEVPLTSLLTNHPYLNVLCADTPNNISEDKPVDFPGLEQKVSEIGYRIFYATCENSDGIEFSPGNIVIEYPDKDHLYIEPSDLDQLNEETDTYLRFRLEELRKRKRKSN